MLENKLYYEDEYMYFSFNGKYSKDYNLMIQNGTDDFKIITNENTNIDYVSPKYQNGRYVMGVTHSHRNIPHKLVAYGLTRSEIDDMGLWLKTGTLGALIYDHAPDWKYNVVVSKLSDFNLYPIDTSHFVVSFDIAFDTIEGTYAENVQDANLFLVEGEFTNLNTHTNIYGINNNIFFPTLACYKRQDSSTRNINKFWGTYHIPVFIHHFGNGPSVLNVHTITQTLEKEIPDVGNIGLQLSSDDYFDKGVTATFTINENTSTSLDYYGNTHSIFVNNQLIEFNDEIQNLDYSYGLEPFVFQSPGKVRYIGRKTAQSSDSIKDIIGDCISTPYHWFVYYVEPAKTSYPSFYTEATNSKTRINNGEFIYDFDIITENVLTGEMTSYDDAIINIMGKILNSCDIWFGFYDKCTVSCLPPYSVSISVTQYNNLL